MRLTVRGGNYSPEGLSSLTLVGGFGPMDLPDFSWAAYKCCLITLTRSGQWGGSRQQAAVAIASLPELDLMIL